MLRYLLVVSLVSATYGCGQSKKEGAKAPPETENILTASDLSTPQFKTIPALDLASELEDEEELFEYQEPKNTVPADETPENVGCLTDFFNKHPIQAADGILVLRFTTDQAFIDCFMKILADAFAKAASESDGTITFTPADPNKKIDPAAECAASDSEGRSSSSIGRAGGERIITITGDHDFSSYDGKSMPEALDENGKLNDSPAKTRTHMQVRDFSDGEICLNRQFSRYTGQRILDSTCDVERFDDGMTKQNCHATSIRRLISVDEGPISMTVLRDEEDEDHLLRQQSIDVVRAKDAPFPHSGTKKVTYRNWSGTITFHAGNPTYSFTDGSETIEGTFATPD